MAISGLRLNLPLFKFSVGRLGASQRTWPELASETTVLEPGGERIFPPAIFLPGDLEKIRGYSPWRKQKTELELINGGKREVTPSVVHRLKDASIVGPTVYKGASRYAVGYEQQDSWLLDSESAADRRESVNLVTSWSGSRWFGCLLLDDYAREIMPADPENNLGMRSKDYIHDAQYRDVLGLGELPIARNVRARNLNVFFCTSTYKAEQYRQLRERLQPVLEDGRSANPVFIGRGTDGERREVGNASELEVKLREWGFDILSPSELTVDEIVRRTAGSRLVMGVEGSHLSHAVFTMAEGGTMVTLQPPSRIAMPYKEFTDVMDMRYALLIGDESGEDMFTVDLDALERLLGLCRF